MLKKSVVLMSAVAVLGAGLFASEQIKMKNHVAVAGGWESYIETEARIAIAPWQMGVDLDMKIVNEDAVYRAGVTKIFQLDAWHFIKKHSMGIGAGVLYSDAKITGEYEEKNSSTTKPYINIEGESELAILKGYLADANNNGYSVEIIPYQNDFLKFTGGFASNKIQGNDETSVFAKAYILF